MPGPSVHLAIHELRITLRDPLPVLLMMAMPLLFMYFLRPVYGGGSSLQGSRQAVPGFTVLFAFFLVGNVGFVFLRDHGWGVWDRLRASRLTTAQIVLGKAVSPLVVYGVQLAVLLGVGGAVFDMPVSGSMGALMTVSAAFAVCLTALGLMLVTLCRTATQLNAIANLGAPVLAACGGALVPFDLLPHWVQATAPFTPAYWAMQGMGTALSPGGSFAAALPAVGALVAFTLASLLVVSVRFRADERKLTWA